MAEEKITDIEDGVFGTLNGRDCIYIDTVTLDGTVRNTSITAIFRS